MKTKSAKRARARRITLAGGQSVEQRAPNDPKREKREDPMQVVAAARMRHSGITDPKEAVQPICGTDIGLCIRTLSSGDDRVAIINAWESLSASHRNYRALFVGMTGNPQGAAIAMVPEPMQTDQSFRVDLRTHDEKVWAAKASWAEWEAKMAALPVPNLKWAIEGALNGFLGEKTLWKDTAPTASGKAAVVALRMMVGDNRA